MEWIKEHKVIVLSGLVIISLMVIAVFIGYFIGVNKALTTDEERTVSEENVTSSDELDSEVDNNDENDENDENEGTEEFDFYALDIGDKFDSGISYVIATKEDDPLRIREEPSIKGKILGKVPNGETVFVSADSDNWGAIEYNGINGFIDLNLCKPCTINTVFVTEDGECFHLRNCTTIEDCDAIQVTISDAVNILGRRPCKVCLKDYSFTDE